MFHRSNFSIKATCCLLLIFVSVILAKAKPESKDVASSASFCEIAADPASFDGKIVSLRATVVSGFEVFAIKAASGDCGGFYWLSYSQGGPIASTSLTVARPKRAPISVKKDSNFKRFQRLLNTQMYPRTREDICIACNRYEVSAMMTGRVDYAGENQPGYGHLNGYKLQFELVSVSEVSAKDLADTYDTKMFSAQPVHLPTGYIEGRLIAPNRKRYEDIWVTATPAATNNLYESTGDADTDKRGRFKISVPPGDYVVGVNVIDPASASFPFRTTYAPAANANSIAQIYTVRDGEHVRADIHLSTSLSLRSIPLRVEWPDGRPVEDANVWLTEAAGDPNIVVGTTVSHTRADGTFVLQGVDETDYVIHADIYVKPYFKKFCAKDVVVRSNAPSGVVRFDLDRQGAVCGR